MGPFTFCENGPISYKATGNMVGAGHGSLLCDLFGNWWKFDTVSISINHSFERRVIMAPAAFDEHGQLVVNTELADYPTYVPHLDVDHYNNPHPAWNLVSYDAQASASSSLKDHDASLAADEQLRTWWSAETANAGEWLQLDLGKLCAVNAVQLSFADQDADWKQGRNNDFCYNYLIEFSQDGETWYTLVDHTGVTSGMKEAKDTSNDYYELASAIGVRYVRVTNKGEIPAGGKFAISSLRLFGNGGGEAPATAPTGLTIDRPASDERSATITWDAVDGAEGYVIRYGCYEDSLSIHYQVIGDTTATIRNLNMGVDYWFTVDAYNDSGYTKGTSTVKVGW
jgi:xylan 1,4-beta-xylosidase